MQTYKYKYQIEKNVPLPKRRKYPFPEMVAGDSFFVPASVKEVDKIRRRVSVVANGHHKNSRKRFTLRKVEGGIRVWRVK